VRNHLFVLNQAVERRLRSGKLTKHFRTHTGEKSFVRAEPGCGKAFAISGNLSKHFRTHTGEKPFLCLEPGCEKAFTEKGTLTRLLRTHTGEKLFVCIELGCGAAFARPAALRNHYHQKHIDLCTDGANDGAGER
jgi:insecticidal toxin complex protein TccC